MNGARLATTEIPADKASYGAFDILFDKAQADLRTIVEDAGTSASKTHGPIRNIPEFYAAFGVKEGDKLFLPAERRVKIW